MGRRPRPELTYIHPYISSAVAAAMKHHAKVTGQNVSRQIEAAWLFWYQHRNNPALWEQEQDAKKNQAAA